MKRLIHIVLFTFMTMIAAAQSKKRFLVVIAHPDDETALAEVLIKYRKKGDAIQVVIATDGKDGTRVTSIPAGDSLGNLRKAESRCACEKLGINPPVFLGIDRLDTRHGVGNYLADHKRLLDLLKEQIKTINPHYIITFGPDGDTHHAEHIVIGASVTELLLREGWVEKFPLYYIAWNHEQGKLFDLGYVHDKYQNVRVEYSQEDENQALEIMPCYKTQYTAAELVTDREKKLNDKSNILHFRRFAVANGQEESFRD